MADEVERIENVADVPADCESFYITHFNDSDEKLVYQKGMYFRYLHVRLLINIT